MSLFAELKRRNVFRVGAAYLVVAWLLLEVSDTIFPRLGLPEWTVTFVIALLAIGFLVARGDRLAALLLMRDIRLPPELQRAVIAAIEQGKPPAQLDELLARYPDNDNPTVHFMLRAYDRAAAWEGRITTLVAFWDPVHAGFRNTPAFRQLLESMGVPEYWRVHGYPPQCRPVDADDYECSQ